MDTTEQSTADRRILRASDQRKARRAEILEVALSVFAQKGYHHTRITDIIDAAGVARGTFYLYFESKSAIFLELLDGLLTRLRASVVGVDPSPHAPPLEVQLMETMQRILDTIATNRLLTTIIIREAVGLDEEVDGKLRQFYGNLASYIREALEEGQRIGIVRPLDIEVAASCILGSVKQLMEDYVMGNDSTMDVTRKAFALLDFSLRGLLAS